jgi:hypothetical protein
MCAYLVLAAAMLSSGLAPVVLHLHTASRAERSCVSSLCSHGTKLLALTLESAETVAE